MGNSESVRGGCGRRGGRLVPSQSIQFSDLRLYLLLTRRGIDGERRFGGCGLAKVRRGGSTHRLASRAIFSAWDRRLLSWDKSGTSSSSQHANWAALMSPER